MSRYRIALPVAAVGLTAALWLADSVIRAYISGGSVLQLLLVPPADAILTRISLLVLSILAVWSLEGMRRLRVARQEAVDEREHIMLLYQNTTDGIAFLDPDLRVIYANPAAERLCGKRLAQTVGWPCYQAFLGQDSPCETCRAHEVFQTGEPREAVKHEVTETGNENWLEQRWYPVLGRGGRIDAVLEVARDITDFKLLQREVVACRKAGDHRRRAARDAVAADAGVA